MLDVLTSYQLSEWEAYDRLDPIGEDRADFRIARLISVVENIARTVWGEEGVEMTIPADYMPEWDKEDEDDIESKKRQTVEEMKQVMLSITDRQNREVKRRKDRPKKKRK